MLHLLKVIVNNIILVNIS